MTNPIATITLTNADVIRAVSPWLLNRYPEIREGGRYEIELTLLPDGLRVDVIRRTEDA